jgi:hypothetical protein
MRLVTRLISVVVVVAVRLIKISFTGTYKSR